MRRRALQPALSAGHRQLVGTAHFVVMVSRHPHEFSHFCWECKAWFLHVPTGAVGATLAAGHVGAGSVMAGKARCTGANCDAYGAARFSLDVVN